MLKHELLLADGTLLTSGPDAGAVSVRSVTLTEEVNDTTDLVPGTACAASVQLELWAPGNGPAIAPGAELTLFRRDTDTGTRRQVGIFRAEQPVKASANVCRITAYDRMILLDRDISPWLRERQGDFPLSLGTLVQGVCDQCGVSLAEGLPAALPQAGYSVQKFYADGLTGRQLIRWAGQIACRFARMTPEGRLTFDWYTPPKAGACIAPGVRETVTALRLAGAVLRTCDDRVWRFCRRSMPYLQGTLRYEDYETAPLDKVQIRQSDSDVGVIYPADAAGTNALVVQGNLLLTADTADRLRPVARHLFETLAATRYTPLSVRVLGAGNLLPEAGGTVEVTDAYGVLHTVPVMRRTLAGQSLTLEATGNARRDSVAAVNEKTYTDLQGKMLEIHTDIDGLDIKASELEGAYTRLELTVDGLTTRTEDLEGNATQLQQTVNGLDLTVVKKGQVRTQFAADADSVTVSSGLVTFTANTLAIESTNFRLSPDGNVTANGSFNSQSGRLRSSVLNGGFFSYAGEELCSAIYGYSQDGQDMGSMRCYGLTNSGGRHEFAVLRAGLDGGQFALTDANGEQNVQITGGVLIAQALGIRGEKNRLVETGFGTLKLHTLESPQPRFMDFGTGVCDEAGLCLLTLDPRFAETVSPRQPPLWQVTPTAPGALWVEPGPPALVHGAPGQTFHWMVCVPQRDYEDQYASRWDALTAPERPAETVQAVLWQEINRARNRDEEQQWQLWEETA